MDKLLYDLLSIPSESGDCAAMQAFLAAHCDAMGYAYYLDMPGNLYVTKGNAVTYPVIASHMDTVHPIEDGGIRPVEIDGAITGINPITMQQTGIGGDDKCGIYAALRCLAELPECKAAFFVDEETGCEGSHQADLTFFSDARYVLQADRRGNSDFVSDINGPLASKAFAKAVRPHLRKHGYAPCSGAMTDVEALRNTGVGVSVANLSAGYYEPHRTHEYIDISDLETAVCLMLAICRGLEDTYPYTPPRPRPRKAAWPARSAFPNYTPSTYQGKYWSADAAAEEEEDAGRHREAWEDYVREHDLALAEAERALSDAAELRMAAEYGLHSPPIKGGRL